MLLLFSQGLPFAFNLRAQPHYSMSWSLCVCENEVRIAEPKSNKTNFQLKLEIVCILPQCTNYSEFILFRLASHGNLFNRKVIGWWEGRGSWSIRASNVVLLPFLLRKIPMCKWIYSVSNNNNNRNCNSFDLFLFLSAEGRTDWDHEGFSETRKQHFFVWKWSESIVQVTLVVTFWSLNRSIAENKIPQKWIRGSCCCSSY